MYDDQHDGAYIAARIGEHVEQSSEQFLGVLLLSALELWAAGGDSGVQPLRVVGAPVLFAGCVAWC